MDCPYIIRENIGFGRVREHGYYQLDEMAYDLTHDFAGADVVVITRPVYNLVMESGEGAHPSWTRRHGIQDVERRTAYSVRRECKRWVHHVLSS